MGYHPRIDSASGERCLSPASRLYPLTGASAAARRIRIPTNINLFDKMPWEVAVRSSHHAWDF